MAKPIVKWAGGKSQLLSVLLPMVPGKINTYFEPFAGGLALYLELNPKKAVINDVNSELINLYSNVGNNLPSVLTHLKKIDKEHDISRDKKEYYYFQRELFNNNLFTNTAEQASRFLYLNKHAFNGLYRVNSKGKFNVPFNNRKAGKSFEEDNIVEVSSILKKAKLLNGDFEKAVSKAKRGDFVFFDSPYAPINETSFTDYTVDGFNYDDHVRLAKLFKGLTDKGVKCMLTNHDTKLIRKLYRGYNIRKIDVRRSINSDASNRTGKEVIITNYDI